MCIRTWNPVLFGKYGRSTICSGSHCSRTFSLCGRDTEEKIHRSSYILSGKLPEKPYQRLCLPLMLDVSATESLYCIHLHSENLCNLLITYPGISQCYDFRFFFRRHKANLLKCVCSPSYARKQPVFIMRKGGSFFHRLFLFTGSLPGIYSRYE